MSEPDPPEQAEGIREYRLPFGALDPAGRTVARVARTRTGPSGTQPFEVDRAASMTTTFVATIERRLRSRHRRRQGLQPASDQWDARTGGLVFYPEVWCSSGRARSVPGRCGRSTVVKQESFLPKAPEKLCFRVAPHIVEDLGLNLYTTLSRVLVEFAANAHDADAPSVEFTIPFETITEARNACSDHSV